MKHIKMFLLAAAMSVAFISCTEEFESTFMPDKPDNVTYQEYLNSFDTLKTYIDRDANPYFKLGAGVAVSEFIKRETVFSLLRSNFDEVTLLNEMMYGSIVGNDSTMDFTSVLSFINAAQDAQIAIHGQALVTHNNHNSNYLTNKLAPTVIPAPPPQSGTITIADFESDALGTTYTMTSGGSGTVVTDPQGTSKVLNVIGVQTHPRFEVTLPDGLTLGNCTELVLDFLGTGSTGMYGGGMRMSLNGGNLIGYGSPSSFGAADNVWLRGMIVLPIANLNLTTEQRELTNFTIAVGSGTGSANYFIDNIKMNWDIPGESTGEVTMSNFESDDAGDTYTMDNGGSGTVVIDPQGSGKVLNVVGAYTIPVFEVSLPDGVTLGNCTDIVFDFLGTGATGMYGAGLRVGLNGGPLANYNSVASFGAADNVWLRGGVRLSLDSLDITEEEKQLTSFTLAVGSHSGSANYYMDNVIVEWKISGDQIIEKTPAQKKQIVINEMDRWIAGILGITKEYVKAWDVVNEPMDDENPSELKSGIGQTLPSDVFYWQDYVGKDYAVEAFKLAAQHGNEGDILFINDNNLESNIDKCKGLIDYVEYIETQGARVDGIGTQMHISTSSTKENITEMFELLVASGKKIRISQLEIGVGKPASEATDEDYVAQADMYKFVVTEYFRIIPAAQRYGITVWHAIDSEDVNVDSVGLWKNSKNQYNRKRAYTAFTEGLSGE